MAEPDGARGGVATSEALYHDPAFADLYDAQNSEAALGTCADFAFVRARAADARAVLDLGCGTGELAVSLAPGRAVVGVDPAEAMLARARRRRGGRAVEWVRADVRGLDLGRRFDLIAMTGHAFQCLLTDEDIASALDAMRRHLGPDGRAIFDTRNPLVRCWERWTPERTRGVFDGPGGRFRKEVSAVRDEEARVVTYTETFTMPDGSVRRATARLRDLRREELEAMLRSAGLRPAEVLGDWRGAPWRDDSPEIVVVAAPASAVLP